MVNINFYDFFAVFDPSSLTVRMNCSFWATVCKTVPLCYRTVDLSVRSCLSCPSVYLSVTLVYCGQTVGQIKMKLSIQVGLGSGHIAFDGNPGPLPERGTAPQFSARICCGQMAVWIKMSLGTEVGLSPGDIGLNGTKPPSPKKGRGPRNFRPCLLWPKG